MDYINMNYKTMDYKEKLERAKELYPTANADQRYVLECLFPELKESEDERIRKDIIWCLKHSGIKESNPINPHVTTIVKDAIAWLEKQGETYTKKDVDDAYIEGIAFAKQELEKQGQKKCSDDLTQQEAMDIAVAKCFEQGKQKPINDTDEDIVEAVKYTSILDMIEQKSATININKMVDDYANTKERGNEEFGLPLNCMIRAYRQGICDTLEQLGEQTNVDDADENNIRVIGSITHINKDYKMIDTLINIFKVNYPDAIYKINSDGATNNSYDIINWLKSLKQRIGG